MRRFLAFLLICVLSAAPLVSSGAEKGKAKTEAEVDVSAVRGGTFTGRRYTAQDGKIVNYWLYVPDVKDTAEKLPILIYFHGYKDTIEMEHGPGELIRTGKLVPKGIVILPQAVRETKNSDFHAAWYQNDVIELANALAEEYNGDLNRLSVSGHSDGGSSAYQIVNRHPGMFAACAPVSCAGTADEGIRRTYLWVFHGAKDWRVKVSSGVRAALQCEKAGCHAMHYVYQDQDHDIQTMVYEDTFTDENGSEVRLMDWLMSKELEK